MAKLTPIFLRGKRIAGAERHRVQTWMRVVPVGGLNPDTDDDIVQITPLIALTQVAPRVADLSLRIDRGIVQGATTDVVLVKASDDSVVMKLADLAADSATTTEYRDILELGSVRDEAGANDAAKGAYLKHRVFGYGFYIGLQFKTKRAAAIASAAQIRVDLGVCMHSKEEATDS